MIKEGVLANAIPREPDDNSKTELFYLGVSSFERASYGQHVVLTLLLATIFAGWFAIASLDGIVSGTGRIISTSSGHVIKARQPGELKELYVSEGQEVRAGQILLSLNDIQIRADYEALRGRELVIRASLSRLRAELLGSSSPVFDSEIIAHDSSIAEREQKLFVDRRQKFAEAIRNFDQRLTLAQDAAHATQPHAEGRLVNVVNRIRKNQDVTDRAKEKAAFVRTHHEEIAYELGRLMAEQEALSTKLEEKRDRLWRSIIVSPVKGKVKNLRIVISGAAIDPQQKIMEIVPVGRSVVVEAQIPPDQVRYISRDMTAMVDLHPHSCTAARKLSGRVLDVDPKVSAGTRPDMAPFHIVRIIAESPRARWGNSALSIKVGMPVDVDIRTPRKTVMSTLLKPFSKSRKFSCFG